MNEHLQRITALPAQACATYPGGKHGVFKTIETSEGKSLSESSFYAALNSNQAAPHIHDVPDCQRHERAPEPFPPHCMAARFNPALTSLDAVSPDGGALNGEIIQDCSCLVALHRACKKFKEGTGSMEAVLAAYEALSLESKGNLQKDSEEVAIMDTCTKQKHLRAVRLLVHALEGHRSSLSAGKPVNAVLADGMAAAHILGIDLLAGEARAIAGRTVAVGRGVEAQFCPPAPACGMERSCPRGDA